MAAGTVQEVADSPLQKRAHVAFPATDSTATQTTKNKKKS